MAQQLYTFGWPTGTYYFEQPWTVADSNLFITARWNTRSLLYFLDLADATLQPLVSGIPMKTGRNLIQPYTALGLPAGKLFVYDTTGNGADAGLNDMGVTHSLCFVTAA